MGKGKMCVGHLVAFTLVVVGALNWGLVGFFNFNLVNAIFGSVSVVERIVYALVGLSGLFMLMMCKCKGCGMGGACKDGGCCPKDGKEGDCCDKKMDEPKM